MPHLARQDVSVAATRAAPQAQASQRSHSTGLNKPRVLIVTSNYDGVADGVTLTLNRLVRWLEDHGHAEVMVLTVDFGDRAEIVPAQGRNIVRFEGSSALPCSQYSYRTAFSAPAEAMARVEAFQPTVVHASSPCLLSTHILHWARSRGIATLGLFHTDFVQYLRHHSRLLALGAPVVWWWFRNFFSLCDHVLAPTPTMVRKLVQWNVGVDATSSRGQVGLAWEPSTAAMLAAGHAKEYVEHVHALARARKDQRPQLPPTDMSVANSAAAVSSDGLNPTPVASTQWSVRSVGADSDTSDAQDAGTPSSTDSHVSVARHDLPVRAEDYDIARQNVAIPVSGYEKLVAPGVVAPPLLHTLWTSSTRTVPLIGIWGRGVEMSKFSPSRRSQRWRSRVAGAGPDEVVIVFVSRLVREKNLDVLSSVLKRLQEMHVPHKAVIVGDGPERQRLQAACPAGTVFAGPLYGDDLATAYASGDIFLFTSDTETFGRVTVEAMASGLPVVAAADGGTLDIVRDGVDGFLIPTEAVDQYVTRIAELVEDPAKRRAMAAEARRHAEQSFQWDSLLEALLEEYVALSTRSAALRAAAAIAAASAEEDQ